MRERADPTAQAVGQDLLELGQRPHRRLLDPGDLPGGGRAQADGDRDRLLVVEQQRRQLGAGAQAVAAGDPRRRLDRVAERAQLVDVATDRARANLEPLSELGAGPLAPHLQQREQRQQACRGLDHE